MWLCMKLIKHLSLKVFVYLFFFNCCWPTIPCVMLLTPSACCLWTSSYWEGGNLSLPLSLSLFSCLSPSLTPHLLDFNQNTAATPFNRMTVSHPGKKHTPPTFTGPHLPFLLPPSLPFFPHIPNHQSTDHTVSACAQMYLLNWGQKCR